MTASSEKTMVRPMASTRSRHQGRGCTFSAAMMDVMPLEAAHSAVTAPTDSSPASAPWRAWPSVVWTSTPASREERP